MQTIYFDFETRPFARGLTIPPPICLAWGTETRDEVCAPDPYMFHDWLVDDTIELANAWIAFDMLVMGTAYPELLSLVHQKYLKGLVRDVALERKLIDIAQGRYERLTKQGWGLDACAARTKFPHKLDKTSWRTEFDRLEGVPIAHYPQGARDYVLFDKRAAAWVDRANKIEGQGQYPGYHGIKVAQASLSLTRASAWGVLTDRRRTEQLEARVTHRLLELKAELVPHGLVREDGSRCLKAAAARILGAWRAAGLPAVLSKSGEAQLKAALKRGAAEAETRRRIEDNLEGLSLDKDAAILSGDELMVAYSEYASQDLLLGRTERAREGWYYPLQTRFDPLKETGRTSSTQPSAPIVGEQMQNFPRGKKDEALGLREVFKPRDGNLFLSADGSMAELHSLAHLCRHLFGYSKLGDMMDQGIDIHRYIAAQMLGIDYQTFTQLANSGAPTGRFNADGSTLDWDDLRTMAKACFRGDTEVLTRSGWVRLDALQNGVEICVARPRDGGQVDLSWEVPVRTVRYAEEIVHLQNESIDLWVTPDHRMAAWNKQQKHVICSPEDLNTKRAFPCAGLHVGGTWAPDARLLRLAVATQADGSYHGKMIRFGFKKPRKIARMRALLGADAVESTSSQGATTFSVGGVLADQIKELLDNKQLPWRWLELTAEHREIVLDEVQHWDSHVIKHGAGLFRYSSTPQLNRDVLQALCALSNRKAAQVADSVSVKVRNYARGGNIRTARQVWGQAVYCVNVSTDALLVRAGGKTVITHNCNFGLPGGMGIDKLILSARKSYGVRITREDATKLKQLWLRSFPEMQLYFRWISDQGDKFTHVHPITGFVRGDCHYCDGANQGFQHLTAYGAKDALFMVDLACFEPNSPLYGFRIWNFCHDEILLEGPAEKCQAAAHELRRICEREFNKYCPSSPTQWEPIICAVWTKKAKSKMKDGIYLEHMVAA